MNIRINSPQYTEYSSHYLAKMINLNADFPSVQHRGNSTKYIVTDISSINYQHKLHDIFWSQRKTSALQMCKSVNCFYNKYFIKCAADDECKFGSLHTFKRFIN